MATHMFFDCSKDKQHLQQCYPMTESNINHLRHFDRRNSTSKLYETAGTWPRHLSTSRSTSPKSTRGPDTKIVVLGNPGVGKSALVVRFLTRRFIWEYDSSLECTYRYYGNMEDEQACLEILDTASQGDLMQHESNIKWGDCFLLVYSITDQSSFKAIAKIYQQVSSARRSTHFPCMITGNKCDMNHERQVTYCKGEALATELGCSFLECSASEGDHNVYEAFWELHRDNSRQKVTTAHRRRRSSAHQVMQQVFNKMFTKNC